MQVGAAPGPILINVGECSPDENEHQPVSSNVLLLTCWFINERRPHFFRKTKHKITLQPDVVNFVGECSRFLITKSAQQIVPIVITLVLRCVCVCKCVLFCVNLCSQVTKIPKKINYIECTISSRTAQVPFFSSLIFTVIFKIKLCHFISCAIISQMARDSAYITIAIRQEAMYLPSNGATANVVYHDLDLHSQEHEFWNVNISKMVRASEKCSSVTFIEVDIFHRMRHGELCTP